MLEVIELTARGQSLTTNKVCVASGLVNEIECRFDTDWQVDATRAIFVNNARSKKISVVLVNGKCNVPHEVLLDKGDVEVNLVGSVIEDETLVERTTSYKTKVVEVKQKVNVDGANTVTPTPSEFEQFVEAVADEVHKVTDMTVGAETLDAGSEAYVEKTVGEVVNLKFGLPRGEKGDRGERGERGEKGEKGDSGASTWGEVADKPFNTIGQNLKVVNGVLTVDTADEVEADETRPITSAGVHVVLGNVESLLAVI